MKVLKWNMLILSLLTCAINCGVISSRHKREKYDEGGFLNVDEGGVAGAAGSLRTPNGGIGGETEDLVRRVNSEMLGSLPKVGDLMPRMAAERTAVFSLNEPLDGSENFGSSKGDSSSENAWGNPQVELARPVESSDDYSDDDDDDDDDSSRKSTRKTRKSRRRKKGGDSDDDSGGESRQESSGDSSSGNTNALFPGGLTQGTLTNSYVTTTSSPESGKAESRGVKYTGLVSVLLLQ